MEEPAKHIHKHRVSEDSGYNVVGKLPVSPTSLGKTEKKKKKKNYKIQQIF
jgi:hypothetical protein